MGEESPFAGDELGGGKVEKGKEVGGNALIDFRLKLYRQLPR